MPTRPTHRATKSRGCRLQKEGEPPKKKEGSEPRLQAHAMTYLSGHRTSACLRRGYGEFLAFGFFGMGFLWASSWGLNALRAPLPCLFWVRESRSSL